MALNLEHDVSELILSYLNIETEKRKAISNRSGNLSFQNRIDLLFDLGILSKEENEQFALMMVFRNQFMHNIKCNSFIATIGYLGDGKAKDLLKFDDAQPGHDLEFRYANAYRKLFLKCLDIILQKHERRLEIIKENTKTLSAPNEYSLLLTDKLFGIYVKLCKENMPTDLDSPQLVEFKSKLIESISTELDNIDSSEEFKLLKNQFTNSINIEKIKRYLKATI